MVAAEAWESIWSEVELIVCLTLRTRADRRAAVTKQFEAHGLLKYVTFLEQEPDTDDGKRGCFHAHQRAARLAMERGVPHALIFEDDVEFLPHFTVHSGKRILRFLRSTPQGCWSIFFLGHFPRAMELTDEQDVVRVRGVKSMSNSIIKAQQLSLCIRWWLSSEPRLATQKAYCAQLIGI
ncbi:hypothetical protein AB1Y20_018184 [Prymnesium parvum]|uniref:Uncharacterized protein n=1 Tax=Prymnesium parvum TaxID=97485 RepID=A0AB34JNA5_PRYPA